VGGIIIVFKKKNYVPFFMFMNYGQLKHRNNGLPKIKNFLQKASKSL